MLGDGNRFALPFRQQQAAQRAQIVQYPAAAADVQGQLGQFETDQLERLCPAIGPFPKGYRDVGVHILAGLFNGLREEGNVFLRTFDAVKRRFRIVAHMCLQRNKSGAECLVTFSYSRTKSELANASFGAVSYWGG